MVKRIFLIVLDSFGIGGAPDAHAFGDAGSNTLQTIAAHSAFHCPNMAGLGLFNIQGVSCGTPVATPLGAFGRLREASAGKDTTIGHWELAGLVSPQPLPTYPKGFPAGVLDAFCKATGRGVLCNAPYSGTEVLRDFGQQHVKTGDWIVYTSADSVFQIAAHEQVVPIEELYKGCELARDILQGEHGVGRVIARPFAGKAPRFARTANRHDYSLPPPRPTLLNALQSAGYETRGVGKIYDIFAGRGILATQRTVSNADGMEKTIAQQGEAFTGLCFVNLVDFDMVYGHRRDAAGYAAAATAFDAQLGEFLAGMGEGDVVMITADHGCDPGYPGTDHTRECVPFLAYGKPIKPGADIVVKTTFADLAATVLEAFDVVYTTDGKSFWKQIAR